MNNKILSLNYANLKSFITTQNIQTDKLMISLIYNIPNILYIKILQSLNNDIKYFFESESLIIFENEINKVICYFKDTNRLRALGDLVNTQITLDIIESIVKSSNDNNITINKFNKIMTINDKLFIITILKHINITDETLNIPKYEYNQIVNFNNNIRLVSQNNTNFYFEYTFNYNTKDQDVENNIQFILKLISFNKIRIFENDILIDNYRKLTNNHENILQTINVNFITIEDLLSKINMSHCVYPKLNGEINHVLIYDGIVCLIDNILHTYYIDKIQNTSHNIIFEVEIDTNNKIVINNIIYDNQIENIKDHSLQFKLEAAQNFITTNKLQQFSVIKPIFFTDNIEHLFSSIINLIKTYNNNKNFTGIIFKSVLSTNKSIEKKTYDYIWKPIDKITIDFLVTINNTLVRSDKGSFFKLNLFAFTLNENKNETLKQFTTTNIIKNDDINTIEHIYPTTINNEIITNNMIVEFNIDFDDNDNIYWIPNKINYNKSLACFYYKKQNGTNIDLCNKIIDYIHYNITENDFYILSQNYENGYKILSEKISNKKIYTKRDPIIDRLFDFVKTDVITTFARWHVSLQFISSVKMIDISCGNGSDLLKLYEYGVLVKKNNFIYHGYNENSIQIESPINGAKSRYNKFTSDKTYSNFPICSFYIYNIEQILQKVNTKYNHFICYDMYKYQTNLNDIQIISQIIDTLMINNSYIFICLANSNISYEQLQININIDIDTVLSHFKKCTVIERFSFYSYLETLFKYKQFINNINNLKTKEFLFKTISAFDKLSNNILLNIEFIILNKI